MPPVIKTVSTAVRSQLSRQRKRTEDRRWKADEVGLRETCFSAGFRSSV
jgi:hypothetical protein